jgi:RNA polymerase sigma-70 factor, ECF subfamily
MVIEAMSDNELVRLSRAGSNEAFAVLVNRYQSSLLHLSLRYVHDIFIAEDIVQDSFLKAYEKLASFQFRSAFKSWLYRITINTAKNSLRSNKHTVSVDQVQLEVAEQCEANLIDKQLLQQAKKIIKDLPDKQQSALKLRVFSDLSFKEVAQKLDCPYDTAKANYRHGLIKLQEKMVITW